MRNARLDESQAGIKSAGRNINNLRYADDTTLMAEGKEKLPGASTGDPTHDKVIWRRPDKQGFRTLGTPWADPTHDKVMWRDLMSKADQDSRDSLGLSHPWQGHVERPDEQGRSGLKGPLDQLEHLPQSRNLSVLLFYAFHQLFWH